MRALPVIAIIDVGKTNKKLFLIDQQYKIVYERTAKFTETVDEDGDPCENLESLQLSVLDSLQDVFGKKEFDVKGINFSTYGASFVYVDEEGKPVAPLYNYLKKYPEALKQQFYAAYGGEEDFSKRTASPVLGSLNSGMQLYRLKYEKPNVFEKVKYALHLPQYLSYLLTGVATADITSIGCHTNLWDFEKNNYHDWVYKEGIHLILPPILPANEVLTASFSGYTFKAGIGLHDSSAALIPYQVSFQEPFLLISTGTWCISLNPFNEQPLTKEELKQDCLCYLHYKGKPVKASRIFAGQEHEEQVKRIANHFNVDPIYFRDITFDTEIILRNRDTNTKAKAATNLMEQSSFGQRELSFFPSANEAYHQLIYDIVVQQFASTQLVLKETPVKRIFVDGGFSKNAVYMNLLAFFFPGFEVFAASMAQATAVGTALAIHKCWNKKQLPTDIIELKYFSQPNIAID